MQLTLPLGRAARDGALAAISCALACWLVVPGGGIAHADAKVAAGSSLFHETGGPLRMTVIMPSASADVALAESVSLHAGWAADIVSGASVAVVDAPTPSVDAISSATVQDTRHVFNGGFTLRDANSSVGASYAHAFEHDYRSDSFAVTAHTELFDHNTSVEISYARAFDRVCDVAGSFEPVMKPRLSSSEACFTNDRSVTARSLSIHSVSAGITQALTPQLTTQLSLLAQVLHGFQSNPYRAVRIGKTAAQEYLPPDRARYALVAGARYWIAPLSAAASVEARAYRDTWGITSLSGELAYDQRLFGEVRLRARGRYYTQDAATFYSDDYIFAPRGRYFTGDRELSPMRSVLFGLSVRWSAPSDAQGNVLAVLSSFELILKGDVLKSFFDDFHYDRAEVPNTLAQVLSLELRAGF